MSWITITGTTYGYGDVVVIDTDLLPIFGVVEDIIMDECHCYYLVMQELHTISFVPHFHSYEVIEQSPKVYRIRKPCNLYDHAVLSRYQVAPRKSFFIPLKYYLVEKL